jgi:NhaD family Na+/H+ antiporter
MLAVGTLTAPMLSWASGGGGGAEPHFDLTGHWVGYVSLILFVIAYLFVMSEEFTHLRKSKTVMLAAGIIWLMIAWYYASHGVEHAVEIAVRHNLLEFGELFLFLLVAMTYISSMEERRVFDAMRSFMVRKGLSYRQLFWITGLLAFFISPVADNLTTALFMCAVVLAVGRESKPFVAISCINIVVAANAGGAFSPFGDITTLMVWQKGLIDFSGFFVLFVPSVVSWLIPAVIMFFFIPNVKPPANDEVVLMKRGAMVVIGLFVATITTAVVFHTFFHLPPVVGMMTGLGYLSLYGYYLKKTFYSMGEGRFKVHSGLDDKAKEQEKEWIKAEEQSAGMEQVHGPFAPSGSGFDIFNRISRAEWDTLMFFYGVILCVGGLGFIGYLSIASETMYTQWGPTIANSMVGIMSAIVDNIPVMFAVLTMNPDMSQGQWLLVTLTAGIGGSLLSIGSAAGVALMGLAHGYYTFFSHLKWTLVIALGYVAGIYTHFLLNGATFQLPVGG